MNTSTRAGALVAVVTLAAGVITACGGGSAERAGAQPDNPGGALISGVHEDTRYFGAEPAAPYQMPDVTLESTNGKPFNLITDTSYPVTLVFFGYTNCPDVCPLVMSDLTSAVLHLPDGVRAHTQVLFITTDPARDTPEVLRTYLDRYNTDFVGLTGNLHDIVLAGDSLGVAIEGRNKLPSGGYDVGHGAQVIGFDHDQAPVIWTAGTPVDELVKDVSKLAGS